MRIYPLHRFRLFALAVLLATLALPAYAQERISVRAVLDNQRPTVGEPFHLQIQVQGSDRASVPDVSALEEFAAASAGGGSTNQDSIININGNVRRDTKHGYVFNYRLTLQHAGEYTIPALTVIVDGTPHQTQPIKLQATKAPESADFKVRLEMPRTTLYIGETIRVRMVWYLSKQPDRFFISAPLFNKTDFRFTSPELPAQNAQENLQNIRINNENTWCEMGEATLDGQRWNTATVTRYMTPLKSGVFELPALSITGTMVVGYEQTGHGSPFADLLGDDFAGDPFFSGRQKVLQKFSSTSAPVTLTVLELPAQGRPADFSGLVGRYSIAAQIEPATAAVGEPLILTVMLTGPDFLKNIELPDLNRQADLARDFRIPAEPAAGKVMGGAKVFTQTLRARNAEVKALPPLRLTYFNPESNRYESAESRALPLTIHATKSVTTGDIEGLSSMPQEGSAVASASGGIFHNYIDSSCLTRIPEGIGHWATSPGWLLLLTLPPAGWLLVVGWQSWRRRREERSPQRQQQAALGNLLNALRSVESADAGTPALLAALRRYFRQRLNQNAPGLSFADIAPTLHGKGAQAQDLEELRKVFALCEASNYAGSAGAQKISPQQTAAIRRLFERLDETL